MFVFVEYDIKSKFPTMLSIDICQDEYFLEHINNRAHILQQTFFDRFEV